jgi:hypothetical protein
MPLTSHFESMCSLLRELEHSKVVLLEHHFHPRAFGSFELIFAKGHKHTRFVWDGKQQLLSVSVANVTNANALVMSWAPDGDHRVPNGDGLFAYIASRTADLM